MQNIPENLKDIVQSDLRKIEFEIVCQQSGDFLLQDIMDLLKARNVDVGPNSVQHFLTALTIRKFLVASKQIEKKRLGRSKLQYRVNVEQK